MADPHLGHEDKMVEACGRPQGYSYKILNNLVQTVKAGDVFICLGDVCFGNDAEWHTKMLARGEQAPEPIGAVNPQAKRWLILGNHDKKSMAWYLDHGWDFVSQSIMLHIYGHKILLSHIPQADTGYTINIHGHFHNTDHRKHEPELTAIANDKQFLLACEFAGYQPVNLQSIIEKRIHGLQKG